MKRQLFIILALLPLLVEADDVTDATSYTPRDWTIIPPAPEVASMMKFVTIPVSPFTGQPNIDLPIYTLREGAIEIPISIRYHGGGIKVDENAGILGLGWSLNAGGCISRTMHGFPDECNDNYKDVKGVFNIDENTKSVRDAMISREEYENSGPNDFTKYFTINQCYKYDQGLRDVSNDVFHINCLGHTGTFIYKPYSPRKMILSTPSPIKFIGTCAIASSNNIGPFVFTDVAGKTYEFNSNDIERTRLYYKHPDSYSEFKDSLLYISAWHISKMTSVTGDTVIFKYRDDKFRFYNLGTSYYQSKSTDTDVARGGVSVNGSSVYYNAKVISEIVTRSTIAVFNYSHDNETLCSISIHRNNTSRDLIRKFVFNQCDFTIWDKTRKLLKDVIEYGANNSDSATLYRFTYSPGSVGSGKAYLAQDEWGYFNGQNNNTLVYNSDDSEVDAITFANRTPDKSYTDAGVLLSITYPTGGSTTFEWEQNDYSYITNSRIPTKDITNETISTHILSGKANNQITEENRYNTEKWTIININGTEPYVTIDCSQYIEPFFSAFPWYEYTINHDNTANIIEKIPRIEIRNMNDKVLKYWYIDKQTSTSADISYLSYSFNEKGQYKIVLCDPTNFEGVSIQIINGFFGSGAEANGNLGYVSFTLHQKYTKPAEKKLPWGGLRIASISSTSEDNSPTISKHYKYTMGDIDSEYSCGTIFEEPNYKSQSTVFAPYLQLPNSGYTTASATIYGYHSNGIYSTPCGGSQIEYPQVWEIYPDNTMVKYSYSSLQNHPDVSDANFYEWIPGSSRMNTSMAFKRGDLLSKEFYDNGFLSKTENYSYHLCENIPETTFTGNLFKVYSSTVTTITGDDGSWLSSNYGMCRYKLHQFNKKPESIEIVEYGDETEMTSSVDYTYFKDSFSEDPKYILPRSKSTENSRGEDEITYYSYIKDTNGNIINRTETEVTVCGGYIINAKKMIYDNKYRLIATYTSSPGLSVDNSFSLGGGFHATNALKNAINIPTYSYRYNNDGNLVEISYNGVVLASYIWGYQGTHPIAEIKGVGYDEVCNVLPSTLHPDVLSNTNSITESKLNSIRSYFPDKDILTMNYHWLIGVATIIDSRGIPIRYNYDSFGRLDGVKDYNNYFIKKYSYNFVND